MIVKKKKKVKNKKADKKYPHQNIERNRTNLTQQRHHGNQRMKEFNIEER